MIVTRFAFSVIVAVGGILALCFGYRLYRQGTGLKADGTKIEFDKVKFSLQTVGAVVMATSIGWAYIAEQSLPKFAQSKDGSVSVTVNSPGQSPVTINPGTISVPATALTSLNPRDAASVEKDFLEALTNAPKAIHVSSGTQDFKPVTVKVNQENNTVNATFQGATSRVQVIYVPTSSANGTLYVPSSASVDIIN